MWKRLRSMLLPAPPPQRKRIAPQPRVYRYRDDALERARAYVWEFIVHPEMGGGPSGYTFMALDGIENHARELADFAERERTARPAATEG